jgi:UDP-glucuronate 4-epimerase
MKKSSSEGEGMILLTGAAGFIGSNILEALLADGHRVVGLDNFESNYSRSIKEANLSSALSNKKFSLIEGDIRNPGDIEKALSLGTCQGVIHMAARAGVRASIKDPGPYVDVNIRGTINVLEAARKVGVRKFVLASSSSVYGAETPIPFKETAACDCQVSPYAASKIAMEHFARVWQQLHGLDITCLRYFTVYGPRQRPEMAIHKFARLIIEGRAIPVFGDGRSSRSYTYISDAVAGTISAYKKANGFSCYNIGETRQVQLSELIELLGGALERQAIIEILPEQPGDVPRTAADISKAIKKLDYNPSVDIVTGLAKFVEWLRM